MTQSCEPELLVSLVNPVLDALSDDQRAGIRGALTVMELRRGSRLYAPGDPGRLVYWVSSGVVKLGFPEPDGSLLVLVFVLPGELFGEACAFDEEPRDHAAVIHEDSVIAAIPVETVRAIMTDAPEFARRLTRTLLVRARASSERVGQLLHRSARSRLARALLSLGRPAGATASREVVIPLRLSCRDLADFIGVRRETASLVLTELRQLGIIDADHRHIVVRDRDALERIGREADSSRGHHRARSEAGGWPWSQGPS